MCKTNGQSGSRDKLCISCSTKFLTQQQPTAAPEPALHPDKQRILKKEYSKTSEIASMQRLGRPMLSRRQTSFPNYDKRLPAVKNMDEKQKNREQKKKTASNDSKNILPIIDDSQSCYLASKFQSPINTTSTTRNFLQIRKSSSDEDLPLGLSSSPALHTDTSSYIEKSIRLFDIQQKFGNPVDDDDNDNNDNDDIDCSSDCLSEDILPPQECELFEEKINRFLDSLY